MSLYIRCDGCSTDLKNEDGVKFENRTYYTLAFSAKNTASYFHYCVPCCNKLTIMDHVNKQRKVKNLND